MKSVAFITGVSSRRTRDKNEESTSRWWFSEIHENKARDRLQCINIGQYSHKKLLLLDN